MLRINELKQLDLGIQGENLAKTITIDINPWLVEYPNGSVTIWHRRNGDSVPSATGAVMDRDEGRITWKPTSTDTYVDGEGEAEIRLTENNVIKKTRKVKTNVAPAVTLNGTPTGSSWQDYIAAVDAIREGAVNAAEDAEDSAEDAEAWAVGQRDGVDVESTDPTYENNAKYYAGQAADCADDADDAKDDAVSAKNDAVSAKNDAESARDAAISAKNTILGMTATASSLPAGSSPSVNYSGGVMAFGIPKGDKGDTGNTGATPEISIGTVTTLLPNQQATVELDESSTAEHPVFNFGITKGATGETGATPEISVGTVTTLQPSEPATVTLDESSTAEAPVFNFGIPKGDTGSAGNVYGNTIDMSSSDSTKVATAIGNKADKVQSATSGNFAALDGNGNLTDSGHKHSDYVTDKSDKADKVTGATSGNFAGLDGNGNLTDSGNKASDFLTSHQDISGKADKVQSATNGNFAALDGNGNLTDSGHKHSDYLTSAATVASGTLAAGSWTSATPPTQTISVTGVTASNNIIVSIASTATSAQYAAAAAGQLLCTAQGAGEITVTCYGTEPTENIPLTVMIMG